MIRDLLLQQGRPAALVNPVYIPAALAGTGLAFIPDFSGLATPGQRRVIQMVLVSVYCSRASMPLSRPPNPDWR